jgi:hypothetical protein
MADKPDEQGAHFWKEKKIKLLPSNTEKVHIIL